MKLDGRGGFGYGVGECAWLGMGGREGRWGGGGGGEDIGEMGNMTV